MTLCLFQSVGNALGGNVIFSAVIKDRQLKYVMKNSVTYAYQICSLLYPCVVGHASKDVNIF